MPDDQKPREPPATLIICGTGCRDDEHDFQGWREFEDGRCRGGEMVCIKCGMGAMSWSLRTGI